MKYDVTSARAVLSRTPTTLRAMLHGLPAEWIEAREDPDAWSPRDVACHLADLEQDGWLPRVHAILDHGASRPLPAIDPDRFRTRYAGEPLERVLDDFGSSRKANLAAIEELELDESALGALGRHPLLGQVRLSQLLSTWVVHDLTHLAQITRTMAAQYRHEVGPWVEFLTILRWRDPSGG